MNAMSTNTVRRRTPHDPAVRGDAMAATIHVILLLLVLGQLVYLGSRHRVRLDATSEAMYLLTESTHRIVGKLEKRLIVEAYLSPKGELPAQLRDSRTLLDNLLDELVQIGRGKVVVQKFNPLADNAIVEKCQRIGVKPIDAQTSSSNAMEVKRHWQGLRLVYGGGRQKVIEQIGPRSTFEAEAVITAAIKEVVTETRRRVGFMEWPAEGQGQQGPQGIGWNAVRAVDLVAKRYEFQNVKDAEGVLVPEDIGTLLLFRPKDLTDRQKYVVDQFLMRGGSLVLFADAADYSVAPQRQFHKRPLQNDSSDSQWKWQDQLLHYGVDLPGKLVADAQVEAWRASAGHEYLGAMTQFGAQQYRFPYPYFFHPVERNWADAAEQLAGIGGRKDPTLVDYYKKSLRPGMDSGEFLFQAFKRLGRGPGFYWPCLVDLRRKEGAVDLPAGIAGRVLLWSSPRTLIEDPPQTLDPLGQGDRVQQNQSASAFVQKLEARLQSEPPRQAGLMVDLQGAFASFFVGKDRPKKPAEIKEEEAKKAAAAAEQAAKEQEKSGELVDADPSKPPADKPLGPEPPKPAEDTAPRVVEPEPLLAAKAPGRILVVGDSDFLRDDFVRGDYRQLGGPSSLYGPSFFMLMLDWLSQDSDLVALQSRGAIDRKLELVPPAIDRVENPTARERSVLTKMAMLVWANVLVPCGVLLVLGLVLLLVRRAQKRDFLASVGN